jgi:hypothetical protein
MGIASPLDAADPVISLDGDHINGDFSNFSHVRQQVTITFDITVTDADGDTATLGASNMPAGAGFVDNGDNTGRMTWTPAGNQRGFYSVAFTANDGVTLVSDTELFVVTAYPLSHGYYRFPYATGTDVRISRDHDNHTPVLKYDMRGIPEFTLDTEMDTIPGEYQIVAGADGELVDIEDSNNSCCNTSCSSCNNHVRIKHRNREWTKYTHFEQNTVTGAAWAALSPNDTVPQSTYLGEEGDVGHTSGVVGSFNRPQTGCGTSPPDTTRPCGVHLHWECRVDSSNSDLRIPMICGIPGNFLKAGDTISSVDCPSGGCTFDTLNVPNVTLSGNDIQIVQANDRITTENAAFYRVQGTASSNFNAGGSITLAPGFSALRHTYFHAWIGPCNSPPGGHPGRFLARDTEEEGLPEVSYDGPSESSLE